MKSEDIKVLQACVKYINDLLGFKAVSINTVIFSMPGRVSFKLNEIDNDYKKTYTKVLRTLNNKLKGSSRISTVGYQDSKLYEVGSSRRQLLVRRNHVQTSIRLLDVDRAVTASRGEC